MPAELNFLQTGHVRFSSDAEKPRHVASYVLNRRGSEQSSEEQQFLLNA